MGIAKTGTSALVIGALGVVFGDIGTSPLYTLQAIFGPVGQHLAINPINVYGIISLVIWTVTLIVSIKYVSFIMRADNKGEGGIMAMVSLIKSGALQPRFRWFFVVLGIMGVALFYGDSTITPAISILSAVEGLKVVSPSLSSIILPITLIILTLLFWIQKYGTTIIGQVFGPVMIVWFVVIGLGGGWQIMQHPDILIALSPISAIRFIDAQLAIAFIAMGAVVLAVTGAEALFADMGHFGRGPIARAWFLLVFPALILCYMGQGALILHDPSAMASSFMLLFPEIIRLPIVILATFATLIASQAVISGAFSLTRQAIHLDFLPKMLVRHTSIRETGQVYIPFINLILFIAVTLLVLFFGKSERLANAYGLAVSGTLLIDTVLFLVIARTLWKKSIVYISALLAIFLSLDVLLVSANATKLLRGGWFPIVMAGLAFLLIHTWLMGERIVNNEIRHREGRLQTFVDKLRAKELTVTRIPGYAVYIGNNVDLAPLALHYSVEKLHELHAKVVIVNVEVTEAAHVPENDRAVFDKLAYDDGISHLSLTYGYHDSLNIPRTLKSLRHISPELNFNPDLASYFISLAKVVPTKRHNLIHWRKSLYGLMSYGSLSVSDYYKLPSDRTVEMRSLIEL